MRNLRSLDAIKHDLYLKLKIKYIYSGVIFVITERNYNPRTRLHIHNSFWFILFIHSFVHELKSCYSTPFSEVGISCDLSSISINEDRLDNGTSY